MKELHPCPFCKGYVHINEIKPMFSDMKSYFEILHNYNKDCQIKMNSRNKEKLIELWNKCTIK